MRLRLLHAICALILMSVTCPSWAGVYTLRWGLDQVCADRAPSAEAVTSHLARFERPAWSVRPWPKLAGVNGRGSVVIETQPAQAVRLSLLYFPGGRARAVDQLERLAEAYQGLPVSIWVIEYPGCGLAPGLPSLAANHALAQAALRHIRQQHPGRPVLAHGLSFGSLLAAELATPAGAFDGLILESAITRFEDLLRGQVRRKVSRWLDWAVGIELQDGLAALDARQALMKAACKPVLILQGESDTLTPQRFAQELREAVPCSPQAQLVLVPAAEHAQTLELQAGRQALKQFLSPLLSGRP